MPKLPKMAPHARKRHALQHWGASKKAESHYVLALLDIFGAVHRAVLHVVEREHLAPHEDAPGDRAGLGPNLQHKIATWVVPRAQLAFEGMASTADKNAEAAAELYGINLRKVPGLNAVIDRARRENVDRITRASADFLADVRKVLDEHEGDTAEEVRKALQERVDVSETRATLIARTETTSLNATIVAERATAAGCEKFRWSTVSDERVRPLHAALDGLVFRFDDPPVAEENGERHLPGMFPNCRCVAAPVIPELEPDGEDPDVDEDPNADE